MRNWLTAYKNRLILILLAGMIGVPALLGAEQGSDAIQLPKATGMVNDWAGALAADDQARLTALSASLQQATGAELVYVIAPTIAPYDDFSYAMAVFDQWKIGQQGKDNGFLILLALKERRLRLMPGYGLEPILPDGKLGRYRDVYLTPFLKKGDVGQGLYNIGLVIAQDIAKAQNVTLSGEAAQLPKKSNQDGESGWLSLVLLIVFIVFSLLSSRRRRRGYYHGGWYAGGTHYRSGGGGFGGGFSGFGGGFSGGGGAGGSW